MLRLLALTYVVDRWAPELSHVCLLVGMQSAHLSG